MPKGVAIDFRLGSTASGDLSGGGGGDGRKPPDDWRPGKGDEQSELYQTPKETAPQLIYEWRMWSRKSLGSLLTHSF